MNINVFKQINQFAYAVMRQMFTTVIIAFSMLAVRMFFTHI